MNWQAALYPFAVCYGAGVALRRELYRRRIIVADRLAGPVVSVGNLGVGGRGKTPVVEWISRTLKEAKFRVSILSRGYRGSYGGEALLVSDGQRVLAEAAVAGDEPVMLARRLPGVFVAVAHRRFDAGRLIEGRFGPGVHVLDDGFQHLRLERDLDIVCIEPSDLHDRLLPAGRLREKPSALQRADAVLCRGSAEEAAEALHDIRNLVDHACVFAWRHRPSGFFTINGLAASPPQRPLLLAAIARPGRFFADAAALVPEVAQRIAFGDHYSFRGCDLAQIAHLVERGGADAIVTTAKDAVRLPGGIDFGVPLLVLEIAVEIDDSQRLRALIIDRVGRKWDELRVEGKSFA